MVVRSRRDRVWAVAPFGSNLPRFVVAAGRAEALPVLTLHPAATGIGGAGPRGGAVARVRRQYDGPLGLKVVVGTGDGAPGGGGHPIDGSPGHEKAVRRYDVVVLAAARPWGRSGAAGALSADLGTAMAAWQPVADRLVVEVTDVAEARLAAAMGADGLVVAGTESGGRVGATGTFVLLQQVLHLEPEVPVWARGGIGPRTAAAAVAGGAAGVVLDVQLALAAEATGCCGENVARALAAMDGSETRLVAGWRVYTRPDAAAAKLPDGTGIDDLLALVGAADVTSQVVPIGQDGALAGPLAEEHRRVGRIVQAVHRAVDDHLAAAVRARPLAPGAPLAAALGTLVPVAQGPMTRVSDRAAFARSVADGGGLPFLALSLMSGPEVRALLEETATLLGNRPWGVGILGFVPPELRRAQLDVVHEVRPPVALIAGGRPSQAAPLEAAGIPTFLHVPSPGLLARFCKEGATRFVFEGRECGGHVGPRTSFVLWEQQMATLEAFAARGGTDGRGSLLGVQVMFAGGVHDERSAAMVAAVAGPLSERGAAVGVLMGTAYLFCEEAVASGAILPAFQQAAVDCTATTLLETSPGHATRCVASPYVDAFTAAKARLQAEGRSTAELWAELEQLNLGRLRIAAKGLLRTDEGLIALDEDTQRAQGMYMIGDVATLRRQRTTIAALHHQVTEGATALLAARAEPTTSAVPSRRRDDPARPADVAIVGMSCVFPAAASLDEFWANILDGVDAVREVSTERWDPAVYFDPDRRPELAGVKTPSKWGGFIDPLPFDALAYGIAPASLAAIEPVQLLALEMAARALADAGYDHRPFDRRRTGVIFGAESCSDLATAYGMRTMLPTLAGDVPEALDGFLPKMTEDSFAGMLANVIAGRIANRLDLGGMNCTVDAACAASLAALDAACKELLVGDSDMVLCGGADLHNGIQDYLLFGSVYALSPTGRCRTFDADADGIVLGEGVACVVLKRLADAERDGDRIYAVIKAVSGSSDGRHLGLTAPRKEGQRVALERAYRRAGISAADVGLVEAHGTGTVVGDRTEMATLAEVFGEQGAAPGSCTIGSVKSNVGHTKCAAGLAGLIKAALAVHRGVRPPTVHVRRPNQAWDPDTSPFRFEDGARPWLASPRVAGVSSFGFGGSNYHVVLASHDDDHLQLDTEDDAPARFGADVQPPAALGHGRDRWPAELLLFRGTSRAEALQVAARVRAWVGQAMGARPVALRHVAAAVAQDRSSAPVQLAVVAGSLAELADRLDAAAAGTAGPAQGVFVAPVEDATGRLAAAPAAVAYCFPGQGSQRPGMLTDLFVTFPALRRWLRAGSDWADLMLPPAAFDPEQRRRQQAALTDTRVAQPALGVAGLAVADLLRALGVRPAMAGGHSYGELVALTVAGSFEPGDLLALSEARAAAILDAAGEDPGTMASVVADAARVEAVLAQAGLDGVVVANRNAPTQSVVSGPTVDVGRAIEALAAAGLRASALPVACAFHSPVVAAASEALAAHLRSVDVRPPTMPVWSNASAAPYPAHADQVRGLVAAQVASPVRWAEQVEAMYEAGARVFVEAGPGRVLTGLVGKILGDRPHVAVACDVRGEPGVRRLLLALAELAVHGVPVDLAPLFEGRAVPVDLAADPAPAPRWTVNGHLVRTLDGQVVPGSLRPLSEVPRRALIAGPALGRSGEGSLAAAGGVQGGGIGVAVRAAELTREVADTMTSGGWERSGGREASGTNGNGDVPAAPGHEGAVPAAPGHEGAVPAAISGITDTRCPASGSLEAALSGSRPGSHAGNGHVGTSRVGAGLDSHAGNGRGGAGERAGGQSAGHLSGGVHVAQAEVPALGTVGGGPVEEIVAAFLQSMRLVVTAQRDVMLRYLGVEPGAAVEPVALVPPLARTARTAAPEGAPSEAGITASAPAGAGAQAAAPVGTGVPTGAAGSAADWSTAAGAVAPAAEPAAPAPAGGAVAMAAPAAAVAASAPVAAGPATVGVAPAPVGVAPAAAAPVGVAQPGGAPVLDAAALLAAVTGLVAERTGYPLDMLDPDQDLEADLSIDSIKRIEVLGELAERVGLPAGADGDVEDAVIEELAQIKTMRGIVDWIVAHRDTAARSDPGAGAAAAVLSPGDGVAATMASSSGAALPPAADGDGVLVGAGMLAGAGAPAAAVTAVGSGGPTAVTAAGGTSWAPAPAPSGGAVAERLVARLVETAPAAPGPATALASTAFRITDDGRGVALALAERLEAHGASVRIVAAEPSADTPVAGERLDGVVDLSALAAAGDTTARAAFPALRAGALAGARWLVAVSATGGRLGRSSSHHAPSVGQPLAMPAGAGIAGLCRTLALELPGTVVRAVDVDPKTDPAQLADGIVAELLDSAGPIVVAYPDGVRHTVEIVRGVAPAAPGGDVAPLGPDSVAVLLGGGRGITATVAAGLATGLRCRLVLVGRTDPDVPDDPALDGAVDAPGLRQALVGTGLRDTAEIERRVRAVLARRQVHATLAALRAAGARVEYRVADVSDGAALTAVLDAVAAEHGRLDLVVHGAGCLDDRLVAHKTAESFSRVFDTKVVGALAAVDWFIASNRAATPAGRPTVVFFGSVSGVFGNRGQVDYAAANDALDTLAWALDGHPAVRVLSVDWGPWGGGVGMVTPELQQHYRRRGIGLLDPAAAVGHLLREVASGSGDAQVVIADADAAALAGPT